MSDLPKKWHIEVKRSPTRVTDQGSLVAGGEVEAVIINGESVPFEVVGSQIIFDCPSFFSLPHPPKGLDDVGTR